MKAVCKSLLFLLRWEHVNVSYPSKQKLEEMAVRKL
jgi:hypothetical protein